MKTFLLLFCVVFLTKSTDDCILKKKMLHEIINDNSIAVFFKNKKELYIYDQSKCFDKNFKIDGIEFKPTKKKLKGALSIINYQVSANCASLEVQLFSENTLYNAKFDVLDDDQSEIKLKKSWVTQIKQPATN